VTPLEAGELAGAVVDEVAGVVLGKRPVLELVMASVLADGHVLLEDVPGTAKTLLARSFATALGVGFARVQFTPDLLPSDITGGSIFDQASGTLRFEEGPVFTNLLLADEINRTPPKTQAALLEAMQERQVTIDGATRPLGPPFLVLATQNPIEHEGTYPLPEAQLDRFLVRLTIGYPDAEAEWQLLAERVQRRTAEATVRQVVGRDELLAMQASLEDVHVEEGIGRYVVALVGSTRTRAALELGASPRGSLALLLLARAKAVLSGRDYVLPDDVKAVAVPALAHRLRLRADVWMRGTTTEEVVAECLQEVPAPVALEAPPARGGVR
jgi:MoxR-like ATPase